MNPYSKLHVQGKGSSEPKSNLLCVHAVEFKKEKYLVFYGLWKECKDGEPL